MDQRCATPAIGSPKINDDIGIFKFIAKDFIDTKERINKKTKISIFQIEKAVDKVEALNGEEREKQEEVGGCKAEEQRWKWEILG